MLRTDHRAVEPVAVRSHINGYGTFRLAMENSGIADRDVVRLTDRLEKDTIFRMGSAKLKLLNPEAVNWIDSYKTGNCLLIHRT